MNEKGIQSKWETKQKKNCGHTKMGQWKNDQNHRSDPFGNDLEQSRRRRAGVDLFAISFLLFFFFFLHISFWKKYNSISYYSYSLYVFLVVYLLFDSACMCVLFHMYKLFYNNTKWMSQFLFSLLFVQKKNELERKE